MNPPTPAVRISRSSSSASALSSPSPSSSSSSSGTATPNHSGPTNGHSINGDSSLISASVPRRAASSLSNSSFSSQSSQQTVKASQLSHSLVANGSANGGLAVVNDVANGRGNGTHRSSSKSPSRHSPSGKNVNGGSALSEVENAVRPGGRSRSGTGSSRTALPLTIPAAPPIITSSTPSSSSSTNKNSLGRQSINIVDALRTWFSQSFRTTSPADRGLKIAFVLLTVVLPLAAFIMRLRIRRRLPSSSPSAAAAPGSGRRLLMRPGANANGSGTVRWLYEAVRDSVVMAGKGLV